MDCPEEEEEEEEDDELELETLLSSHPKRQRRKTTDRMSVAIRFIVAPNI